MIPVAMEPPIRVQNEDKIVFIVSHWPNGQISSGSGALVGRNDILTATHVVFNPSRGGAATSFDFYFQANYNGIDNVMYSYGDALKGQKVGENLSMLQWSKEVYNLDTLDDFTVTQEESQYDNALIGITRPLGDKYGWFEMAEGYDHTSYATAYGFPIDCKGIQTDRQFVMSSTEAHVYASNDNRMGIGSSGGPLVVNGKVIGVKSAGSGTHGIWSDIGQHTTMLRESARSNNTLIDVEEENEVTDTPTWVNLKHKMTQMAKDISTKAKELGDKFDEKYR
jgi:V8-like Glu-specific endopeptidase